uniref:Uncharacterized protein n=1 Tax=Parascaris equorum TaxID=6256 RepID=A0A914R6C1_PAREQ
MSPRNLRFAPRVTLAVDPESTFTLVMIVAEWLHWLVND